MSGNPECARNRAAAYIAKMGPAVQGQGGDNHTYKVACALVIDFDLPHDAALDLISVWNTSCVPPWSERDLVQKLRSADKSGTHERGGKLRERPARPDPDDAYDLAVYVAFTLPSPAEVQQGLEAFDAALPWRGPMRSVPSAERQAALLLALHSRDRVERGPQRVPWIMKQAARDHFVCVPSPRAKRDESLFANDSIDGMQSWRRTKTGVRHGPRVLPYAIQRPEDPEMLLGRWQETAAFRASLSPLQREVFDSYGESDDGLARSVGSVITTAKTIHSTRNQIRKKAKQWGTDAREAA